MSNDKLTSEQAKSMSITEVYSQLSTNEKGLNKKEAEERLEKYGYNEIPEKKESPKIFGVLFHG